MDAVISPKEGMFRSLCGPSRSCSVRSVFDCLQCKEGIAVAPISYPGAFGVKVPLPGAPEAGGWELMEFEGKFFLVTCDCDFPQDRSERVGWEGLTEFHFTLTGPVSVEADGASTKGEQLSVVICRMGHQASYEVTCAKGRRRSIALFVHDKFIEALMGGDCADLLRLHQDLKAVGEHEVFLCQLAINRKLGPLVESIVNSEFDGARRLAYAEGKSMELLCETIAAWRAQKTTAVSRLTLRPRDVAMFEKARETILSNLAEVPNIRELARALGTNGSKLTLGFRVLYGVTINQFTLSARMDQALSMLTAQEESIADIAAAVGYQHQSSFTQAFTRYFGFLPSKARALGGRATSAPEPSVGGGQGRDQSVRISAVAKYKALL